MSEKKKVSIIIPIYKAEKYLKKCLDSVIEQTYKNIEIILIDDGSPDDSGKICNQYSEIDRRIVTIHSENRGVSNARNTGVKKATGEYITFIDADDYISNNYIEVLQRLLIENKADISIIGNDERYDGSVIKISEKFKGILTSEETIGKILEEKYITSVCWGKMYTKKIIKNSQIQFDSTLKIGEDFKFMMQVLENCSQIAVDTTQNLYHYRLNEDSVTQQINRDNDWIKEIDLSKEIMHWIQYQYPKLEIKAIQRYIRVNITFCIKGIKDKKNNNIKEQLKLFRKNINGYKFKYLFMTSASMKYKIKFLSLLICPHLLSKLYEIKRKDK